MAAGASDTGAEMVMEMADMEPLDLYHWHKVMELLQVDFREGRLEEEATWQAVVLIPKGREDYRCFILVELAWKVVTVILN